MIRRRVATCSGLNGTSPRASRASKATCSRGEIRKLPPSQKLSSPLEMSALP